MRKRDRGKNPLKKVLNHVKYGGPTVKIAFVMRGATLFSLAIPQFKNPKLSNFANKPEKHPKKGKLVQIAQKIHLTMRKNGAPPRKIGKF